ncbi:MAG: fumarate reductase subunit C [Armatimonadota bacterium]|nr:fumarate reductase subunit C [Armatimonadota bacterium]MDR7535830.1 fumarate reductase subunit C [Armatimonadota bacterium]
MTPYRRPVRFTWWWGHRAYTLFVARELTSIFVAATALVLLGFAWTAAQGREAYEAYVGLVSRPGAALFHAVALVAVTYHAVTWWMLAPRAAAVRVGGRRLPPRAVLRGAYAAWAVASAVVAWLVLRGA